MRRLRQILRRLLIALTAAVILAGFAAFLFPRQLLTVDSGDVKGDVIVVLGGGANQQRPERAADLFKAGQAPTILVSGFGDAELSERALRKNGVPAAAIEIESSSMNTLENAKFSIPMLRQLGAHRIILVTSWYHSRRALACFRHFAPDMEFYSRPSYWGYSDPEWNRQGMRGYSNSEYVKLLGYWVGYGICPL